MTLAFSPLLLHIPFPFFALNLPCRLVVVTDALSSMANVNLLLLLALSVGTHLHVVTAHPHPLPGQQQLLR
jgi:hypothetical protein